MRSIMVQYSLECAGQGVIPGKCKMCCSILAWAAVEVFAQYVHVPCGAFLLLLALSNSEGLPANAFAIDAGLLANVGLAFA
eukprot:5292512-Pleurochrysis_carterae.AAC.2